MIRCWLLATGFNTHIEVSFILNQVVEKMTYSQRVLPVASRQLPYDSEAIAKLQTQTTE